MESPRDITPSSPDWLVRLEKLHPHQTLLGLAMIGSGLMFAYFMVAFAASQTAITQAALSLPKAFILSTLVIIFSSFWLVKVTQAFAQEQFGELRQNLSWVMLLGILFTLLQAWGWYQLLSTPIEAPGQITTKNYLFLMSGLHFLHLLGGLIFLLSVRWRVAKAAKDPVHSLITSTTPYRRVQIRMLVRFWHYLDLVWVVLFLFFLLVL